MTGVDVVIGIALVSLSFYCGYRVGLWKMRDAIKKEWDRAMAAKWQHLMDSPDSGHRTIIHNVPNIKRAP